MTCSPEQGVGNALSHQEDKYTCVDGDQDQTADAERIDRLYGRGAPEHTVVKETSTVDKGVDQYGRKDRSAGSECDSTEHETQSCRICCLNENDGRLYSREEVLEVTEAEDHCGAYYR